VDRAVVDWFKATRSQNIPVSGALIKEKALELAGRLRENISIQRVTEISTLILTGNKTHQEQQGE
jgi:hypothetical protein